MSNAIQLTSVERMELERRLSVRLLERTTRVVRPTLDGEAYYQRCIRIIADVEDAEAGFSGAKPSGLLRVDVHGTQARHFLLPGLPDFLRRYPDIRLHISEMHQPMDLVREGYDCIVRVGELSDSSLIRRKLAELKRGTFASPDYLARFKTLRTPDDLVAGHQWSVCSPPIHARSHRSPSRSTVKCASSPHRASSP